MTDQPKPLTAEQIENLRRVSETAIGSTQTLALIATIDSLNARIAELEGALTKIIAILSTPSGRAPGNAAECVTPTAPREGTDSGRRGKLYDKTEDWDMRHATQAADLDEGEAPNA